MRVRTMKWFAVMAIMLAAVMATSIGGRGVLAQEASPEASPAAIDMGNCTEALGIGTETDACVNILHASPDAPAVDIWVDGAKAVENLAFGAATGWVALPEGDHQVVVVPTGGTADQAVIDVAVTLEAGQAYEVAAAGLVAEIAPQIYPVNLSMLAADTARVRVIHTSPDAPAVDIAVKGGDVLIADLAFPAASDALEVPAATYDLEVRPTGTMDVALDLPGVELQAGMAYSVYAIGLAGDGTLTVFVIASPTEGAMIATPEAM